MDELVQATSSKVRARLDLVFSNTICFVAKYCVHASGFYMLQ